MITHEQAKEALRIMYFNMSFNDAKDYRKMRRIVDIVSDYIDQQIENDSSKKEKANEII